MAKDKGGKKEIKKPKKAKVSKAPNSGTPNPSKQTDNN